jgi:regulator of cell morphogenesis and NO signaling
MKAKPTFNNLAERKVPSITGSQSKPQNWELDGLMEHILNTHHYYIWVNLPVIKEYSLKVSRMQGIKYPVLVEVNRLFKELASDLEQHLSNQEQIIFPYIKRLVYANRDKDKVNPEIISMCSCTTELDHQYFVERLKLIVNLLSKLKIANEPETTPSVLLYKLKAFHENLLEHIALENNILFPKAMHIEDEVLDA